MELYAFHWIAPVAQAHNDADAVFASLGADFEFFGQPLFRHNQRVVTRGGHRVRNILEDGFAIMPDVADFAVHDFRGADHLPAQRRANGLMSQAYAQNGAFSREMPHYIHADTSLLRRAGARRNQDVVRRHALDILSRDLIVTADFNFFSQFAQILDQVVGEGIVVVENKDHRKMLTLSVRESPAAFY